jgi:hypothetical protein
VVKEMKCPKTAVCARFADEVPELADCT